MLAEYQSVVPTRVLGGGAATTVDRVATATQSLGWAVAGRLATSLHRTLISPTQIGDVVVANTVASLPLATHLARRWRRRRLVCHVLELDGVVDRILPRQQRFELIPQVDRFIATGSAVAEMLVDRWGVQRHKVTIVDPWVDLDHIRPQGRPSRPDAPDRPVPRPPVILSTGSMTRRKGPDRFVDLMTLLSSHPSHPVGVWLGGSDTGAVYRETQDDIRRAASSATIRLVTELDTVAEFVRSADIAVSTAIEDPFAVVFLEAAAAGVPYVGFSSGGLAEALATAGQADGLVEVDDLLGLARVVRDLLDHPLERRRRGTALSRWVHETHLVEHLVPAWWTAVLG